MPEPKDCPSFEGCSAPLCPLDQSFPYAVFYADEPICSSLKFRPPFVKIQRRIAKRVCTPEAGYFTVKMLQSMSRVTPQTKGIDPNSRQSEEIWVSGRVGNTP